ncbi:AAA family ATPase [Cellulomonas sp. KRMCY2]|uniref:AAA family ATPase n=1 Tax=Cellulomonas sp. KRMCY2 TaxID=1304865 RepID=UPI0018CC0BDC|nr:AAA family ATPase [Cellulomonas sp. KRMCY2]
MPDSVYEQLHTWSTSSLVPWQQDALRRIVQADFASRRDTEEVAGIAYRAAADRRQAARYIPPGQPDADVPVSTVAIPLELVHLPVRSSSEPPVRLGALRHISGVNRLKPDAAIPFALDGLTVVYGGNGVGKSGFTRILKRACHSRAPEEIVPNVFSDIAEQPRAALTYLLGDEEQTHTWDLDKDSADPNLPRIAIYDNRGAMVHFHRNGAQVELLPPGLDALARLADFYDEIAGWAKAELARRRAVLPPGAHRNAVALRSQMDAVGTQGAMEALQVLALLSPTEEKELASLADQIRVLESGSRKTRIAAETLHESQFRSQSARVATTSEAFSNEQITQLAEAATSHAETLRDASTAPAPPEELLEGVHGAHWEAMWEAALAYALNHAYRGESYSPEEGSLCLLCQQPLDGAAAERLQRYASRESETSAARMRRLKRTFQDILRSLTTCSLDGVLDPALLAVLPPEAAADVSAATAALTSAAAVCERIDTEHDPELSAEDEAVLRAVLGPLSRLKTHVSAEADRAHTIIETLSAQSDDPQQISALRLRLGLLQERKSLQGDMEALIALHDAKIEADALNEVLAQSNTQPVSRKSGTISETYVTAICEAFSGEAALLGGFDICASMAPLTTQKGTRRTGIVLRQAKRTSIPADNVLSEGELRVMSLAAFFADLRGSGEASAIVLDDPMTSLDHRFQRKAAERLVREARSRQVIVFTHSTAFLSEIQSAVEDDPAAQISEGIDPHDPVPLSVIEVARDRNSGFSGIKVETFVTATNVLEERVKHLGKLIAASQAHWDAGEVDLYERSIENFARHLRGSWESAVEDLLLCKIVRRNRKSITTENRISGLIGITAEEVASVAVGMNVESFFVHSTPDGSERDSPTPDELRSRVDALREWIQKVKARQKSVRGQYPI